MHNSPVQKNYLAEVGPIRIKRREIIICKSLIEEKSSKYVEDPRDNKYSIDDDRRLCHGFN